MTETAVTETAPPEIAATETPVPAAATAGGAGRVVREVFAWLLLAVLCAGLFLPGLFTLPPTDRDEARFVQATRQMLESRDFVDIRFQEQARHKKPVGIYWLQSVSVALFSPADDTAVWAYRLPSVIGATLAVLLTAWAGTRLFGLAAGVLGAVMLAGSVLLGVEARLAKTDAVLLATVVAAQAALAFAYLRRDSGTPSGWGAALTFWGALGVGVLVKGPIAPMVAGFTVLALAVADRRVGWLRHLRPGRGLLLMLAIVAPWLVAITIATEGAFFTEAVGHDMLAKVAGGQESHGAPPGYYLGSYWLTFAPFAALVVPALPWIWANRRTPAVRFCLAWIIPTWILFEAVPTKLPHYVLPVLPAVALLIAAAAADGFGITSDRPRRWALRIAAVLILLVGAALAVAVAVMPWLADPKVDLTAAVAAAAMAPTVIAGLVLGVTLLNRGRPRGAILALTATVGVLYGVTWHLVLPQIGAPWVSREAAAAVRAGRPCESTVVASAGYTEPSLVFLVGTRTRLGTGDSAARHLLEDPDCALALVEAREEPAFRQVLAEAAPVALATVAGFNYSKGRPVTLTLYAMPR